MNLQADFIDSLIAEQVLSYKAAKIYNRIYDGRRHLESSSELTKEMEEIIQYYVKDTDGTIEEQATVLALTEESLDKSRSEHNDNIELRKDEQGSYFAVKHNRSGIIYLLPSKDLSINRYTQYSIELLYRIESDCYSEEASTSLLKPAVVEKIENNDTWKLKEKGIIEAI